MATTTLPSNAISKLRDLLDINVDSEKGFQLAAREVGDSNLAELFEEIGQERGRNAEELKPYLAAGGSSAASEGTTLGSVHRWWIDVKTMVTGQTPESVLNEAERGEDSIKKVYENALSDLRGTPVETIVSRQYENVKMGHDQVKALRDRYRNPA